MISESRKYLLIPIPKTPYFRVGPEKWQDWYRQTEQTIVIARAFQREGHSAIIGLISNYRPKGKLSEIEVYSKLFNTLAPELDVRPYQEAYDTLGQVEKSFELSEEMGADPVFISTWMHFPRVMYLARGRKVRHYGVFGIPSPIFAFIDPLCIFLQPIVMVLGLSNFFQRLTIRRREKGSVW